jgi:hypothetical protein
MGRFPQPVGKRGSQKWIQSAVNEAAPRALDRLIIPSLGGASTIAWCSPLAADQFAEYRDAAFLKRIGADHLASELADFWPAGGPQWDALGRSDAEDVLLVEAKAHINEIFSPASAAGETSRQKIEAALAQAAVSMGAVPRSPWTDTFYQLANRLAHLYFLRKHALKAWLVLVNFVGDEDMRGPTTREEWEAAYKVVWHVLGVAEHHALSRYVVHCFPRVPI